MKEQIARMGGQYKVHNGMLVTITLFCIFEYVSIFACDTPRCIDGAIFNYPPSYRWNNEFFKKIERKSNEGAYSTDSSDPKAPYREFVIGHKAPRSAVRNCHGGGFCTGPAELISNFFTAYSTNRSPQVQHRSEYRSLAVMRNVHTP
jgi:hypothetical protein